MDNLTEKYRNARSIAEKVKYGHRIQEIIAEEDLYVPGYMREFERVATWRWVRWPDVPETRFTPPLIYRPEEGHCFWVDERMKEETLEAIRTGKTFPEVERVVEDYRVYKTTQTGEEVSQ